MSEAPALRLAAAIQELARVNALASPPPRALPYLGLEHPSGTGLHLLDGLAGRGIFRKYEFVLELGSGLGGRARWLATRLGCDVVGTTTSAVEAKGATELTRRAGLAAVVRAVPARAEALPFREHRFTHVWALETLPTLADPTAALAEMYRVLRPGGHLAVQEIVPAGAAAPSVPGWRFADTAERVAAIGAAGFVELHVRDVTADAAERSARVQGARRQLLERIGRDAGRDPAIAALIAEREALAAGLATGALRVVQLSASRPA
jgi:SAM-dependent methyltransferase